jgi:hypothetical protein
MAGTLTARLQTFGALNENDVIEALQNVKSQQRVNPLTTHGLLGSTK